MVDLYARLIISHRRTLDSVPENLKDQVVERLKELGFLTED